MPIISARALQFARLGDDRNRINASARRHRTNSVVLFAVLILFTSAHLYFHHEVQSSIPYYKRIRITKQHHNPPPLPIKLAEEKGCLRESIQHPVKDRESYSNDDVFGYPSLQSVRGVRNEILDSSQKYLISTLNNSATVNALQPRPFHTKCVRAVVPRKFHYVWFGSVLPQKYVTNIVEMATNNTGWMVYLWGEHPSTSLEHELQSHGVQYTFKNITQLIQSGDIVNGDLISKEENLAGKSDYLRLEAVFLEGGIYQDTDAHPLQAFDTLGDIFRWPFFSFDPYDYQNACNCVFGAEQGSKFLEFAIHLTRENCLKYNECGVMLGAGPSFVTAALYLFDDPDIILIDQLYMIRQWFTKKSVTYHTMDATWRESYCRDRDC